MRLIFLGPPGAGKGTVARLLKERLGVNHLSSGDLLREAVRQQDEMGKKVAHYIQAGNLVPDEVITNLMLNLILKLKSTDSFVLDGFPRTVDQACALDDALEKGRCPPIDLVVDFELVSEAVVTRLVGRRVCEKSGANYHVDRLLPKKEGICDRCGGSLKARGDDQPDTVRQRLMVYHEQTAPLVSFYQKQRRLRAISGEPEIERQYQELVDVLKDERLVCR